MNSFGIALIFTVVAIVIQVFTLRFVMSWRATQKVRFLSALAIVLACNFGAVVVWVTSFSRIAHDDRAASSIAFFSALGVLAWPAIYFLGDRGLWRTTKRWMVFVVVVVVQGLVFGLLIEEMFLRTVWANSLNMLPAVRGRHTVQPCPKCGGEFAVRLFTKVGPDGTEQVDERFLKLGTCEACFYTANAAQHQGPFHDADHYMINMLRSPERWRIVAFGHPTTGGQSGVGRLVGLPGETLSIHDGGVWVNGERLTPPSALAGLRYSEDVPRRVLELREPVRARGFGHPAEPLTLGPDEYFLLQDSPLGTSDSRTNGPYRRVDYLGVVDAIYWPPSRWRQLP